MSKVKTRTRSETSKSDETVKKTKSTTNVNIDPDDNQVNSVVDLVLARRLRSASKGSESDCSPCFFTLETSQSGKTLGSPYRSSPKVTASTTPNKLKSLRIKKECEGEKTVKASTKATTPKCIKPTAAKSSEAKSTDDKLPNAQAWNERLRQRKTSSAQSPRKDKDHDEDDSQRSLVASPTKVDKGTTMSDLYDDSLLDMFGHMEISKNQDSGKKLKSPEQGFMNGRSMKSRKGIRIKDKPKEDPEDNNTNTCDDQVQTRKEPDQVSGNHHRAPDTVSLVKSVIMSTVGVASAALVVYVLNCPCMYMHCQLRM